MSASSVPFLKSIRFRSLLLLGLILGFVLCVAIFQANERRQSDQAQALERLKLLTQIITQKQQEAIRYTQQYMTMLVETGEAGKLISDPKCEEVMSRLTKQQARFTSIFFVDAGGTVSCTPFPATKGVSASQRAYVQKALASTEPVMGEAILGSVHDRWVIPFAQSVRDPSGTVRAVLIITLDLLWVNGEFAKTSEPGLRLGLYDTKGNVLARHPDPEGYITKNMPNTPVFRALIAQDGTGTAELVSYDGESRIYAFSQFAKTLGSPIYLWVNLPKKTISAAADQQFAQSMGLVLILIVLTFAAAWFGTARLIIRPLEAISRAARKLSEGDHQSRTGIKPTNDELGQLARVFDEMALALLSKNEILRLNRALKVLSQGSSVIVHADIEQKMLNDVCRIIVETGGYSMAWIGFAEDDAGKSVRLIASYGDDGYLEHANITWADTERGQGPTGTAIRTGRPCSTQNFLTDPTIKPWLDEAQKRGYQSSGAFPLTGNQKTFGAVTIYSTSADRFDQHEVLLLSDLAKEIAYGIQSQRAERGRLESEMALRQLNEELEEKVETRTIDLQRAQRDAEEANQAKSSFLAAMSHEIRTPMNGVVGMIDVLHQSSLKSDQVEMVDLIRDSAFSLLGIINDILDFSKIEAGKLELEREPIALTEVVESVCGMLDRLAQKKDVGLMMYTDPAIPAHVLGDALRLRQVLINLANNAIKFCSGQPRAGRVSVRAVVIEQNAEEVKVEFQIIDNGIGMDEKTRERLFTAFAQADASTTRRFGGTGLGLVIAGNLAELMGGQIEVQSTVGVGSTFKVCLPFAIVPVKAGTMEPVSKVAELPCVVVGMPGGLADDLAAYLTYAKAEVEQVPDVAQARMRSAGRSGPVVWILVAGDEPQSPEQIPGARSENADIRIVAVQFESGKRLPTRVVAPDMITVDGNVLSCSSFLKAVAMAAGRVSLEEDEGEHQPEHVAVIAPTREEALRQGRLILIAEDNETNQKVIIRQLTLLGYTADVAADGREALVRWQSGEYALLLTDLHMPHMDGYELTQAIRAEEKGGKRTPIIALTANALKGEADHCRAIGMDDYRSKPTPLTELKSVLEHWLPAVHPAAESPASTAATIQKTAESVPVDVNVLKGLVGDDPDLIREFLQDFRVSALKTAAQLGVACNKEEAAQVGALAHKLKSAALSVGALGLGELCAQMEEGGKASDNQALALLLAPFNEEMAAVEQYLATMLGPTK